jgi:hypothetical protein
MPSFGDGCILNNCCEQCIVNPDPLLLGDTQDYVPLSLKDVLLNIYY